MTLEPGRAAPLRAVPSAAEPAPDHAGRVDALFRLAEAVTPPAGIRVTPGPTPQRLAPFACTLLADATDSDGESLGSGRLVLLHDPNGHPGWGGTWRVVVYTRADVDEHMASDPLLPEVAWSWFGEAWHAWSVSPAETSATVTCNQSRPFGDVGDRVPTADVEVRCSWTPPVDGRGLIDVEANVRAWLQVMAVSCGRD